MTLDKDGKVTSALWDGPAFKAGLVNGAKIVAVNGRPTAARTFAMPITAAKGGKAPIQLLVKRGDAFETVPIAYDGGLRYPWIESTRPGKENGLDRCWRHTPSKTGRKSLITLTGRPARNDRVQAASARWADMPRAACDGVLQGCCGAQRTRLSAGGSNFPRPERPGAQYAKGPPCVST